MKDPFTIHFGPFSVGIVSPFPPFIEYLKRFFAGYESDRRPDFVLTISSSKELPPPLVSFQQEWVPLALSGSNFEIGHRLIQGTLHLQQRAIEITLHEDFFNQPILDIFQGFLYQMYHTMCLHQGINSYFIHGCGIIRETGGYLFIGPHQSGKTTIGELSGCPVLHDDQILITLDEGRLFIDSPPLSARIRSHPEKPVPLQRVFLIVQDKEVSIRAVVPSQALARLYSEIVSPLTLDSANLEEAGKRKGQFCFELLRSVSILELHFDNEGRFWQLLNSEQGV
jgi:hypothetical protein